VSKTVRDHACADPDAMVGATVWYNVMRVDVDVNVEV
jgi:hypothetical protein